MRNAILFAMIACALAACSGDEAGENSSTIGMAGAAGGGTGGAAGTGAGAGAGAVGGGWQEVGARVAARA